jgi:hypothetical protein
MWAHVISVFVLGGKHAERAIKYSMPMWHYCVACLELVSFLHIAFCVFLRAGFGRFAVGGSVYSLFPSVPSATEASAIYSQGSSSPGARFSASQTPTTFHNFLTTPQKGKSGHNTLLLFWRQLHFVGYVKANQMIGSCKKYILFKILFVCYS